MDIRTICVGLTAVMTSVVAQPRPAAAQQQPPAAPKCEPHYEGNLVLEADPNGRTMVLKEPYAFVDASCQKWSAPAGAVVDGASIPRALWTVLGGPFEGAYRNASVIHDWFCAIRDRPWQNVHLMFFEAMRASGVTWSQAKLMYFGVYYGGPRWDTLTLRNIRLLRRAAAARGLMQLMPGTTARRMTAKEYADATAARWAEKQRQMPQLDADMLRAAQSTISSFNLDPQRISDMATKVQIGALRKEVIQSSEGSSTVFVPGTVGRHMDLDVELPGNVVLDTRDATQNVSTP